MNRFGSPRKPLMWFAAMMLATAVSGCGGDGDSDNVFGNVGSVCAGASCVSLGSARNYVILAKSGISTVPTSAVTGNPGISPAAASSITGFSLSAPPGTFSKSAQVTGKVFAADYNPPTPSNLTTAVLAMQAAYTDAAGPAPTSAGTTNLGAGTLASQTLTPSVYEWGAPVMIPTDLIFNGNATDVWILGRAHG